MKYYKSYRIVDGKPRWIIIDENGKIVNRNPSKDELKLVKNKDRRNERKDYNEELLDYLRQFCEENGRPPIAEDFTNSPYPSRETYRRRFGSWSNALKLVGLDVESIVKKGVLVTNLQKGRFGEIIVRDHFKGHPVDLAGENNRSPCDGICPNGKTYDVKSSILHTDYGGYYHYGNCNKYKDKIEIYYILAFNKNYSKLEYAWRVTGWEVIEKDYFDVYVNSHSRAKFTIENMKEYDITDKIRDVLEKYEFFNKVKKGL
jgi:hypothetical protein